MLDLAFETQELRAMCERAAEARRALGERVGDALLRRVADLRAATCVFDLLLGCPRLLDGEDRGRVALDLRDGQRLVLAANHPKNPLTPDGMPDWTRVTRVRVVRIDVDHDH